MKIHRHPLSVCLAALSVGAAGLGAAPREVLLPAKSPIVTMRFVFTAGAADDANAKPGVASLTAAMLAEGGTSKLTYNQIVDAFFPMAASVRWQVDKEMSSFSARTHIDNLDAFYAIFRDMLLDPGWREEDFKRLRDNHVNALRVNLRGNNDEELGKEVLYNLVYAGHPYGRHNLGAAASLNGAITLADLKNWHATRYTQSNLIIGLAGGYPDSFLARVRKDFARLPAGRQSAAARPQPRSIEGVHVTLVDKPTRSVAISIGFPIEVLRGHPDYIPLLVAAACFGQHRTSGGRLYERIREQRGLNYGDYSYTEYFPNGMFRFEPAPNLARRQQIFQMWIRPLEPPTAQFGLRLAMYELEKLLKEGITEEEFRTWRSFLNNYVDLLTKSKDAETGYAIDSAFYGIPEYNTYVKNGLAKLTREDVNRAIRKHLRATNLHIAIVTDKAADFRTALLSGEAAAMAYNSPKPAAILEEDKIAGKWKIDVKAENVKIVPVASVFEK